MHVTTEYIKNRSDKKAGTGSRKIIILYLNVWHNQIPYSNEYIPMVTWSRWRHHLVVVPLAETSKVTPALAVKRKIMVCMRYCFALNAHRCSNSSFKDPWLRDNILFYDHDSLTQNIIMIQYINPKTAAKVKSNTKT